MTQEKTQHKESQDDMPHASLHEMEASAQMEQDAPQEEQQQRQQIVQQQQPERGEQEEGRIRVAPQVCASVDEDHRHLSMEIILPGVSREDINLHMHSDGLSLSAPRGNLEYVATMSFCCPVKADEAQAKYKEGLLTIEVPFEQEMKEAVHLKVE